VHFFPGPFDHRPVQGRLPQIPHGLPLLGNEEARAHRKNRRRGITKTALHPGPTLPDTSEARRIKHPVLLPTQVNSFLSPTPSAPRGRKTERPCPEPARSRCRRFPDIPIPTPRPAPRPTRSS